MSERTYSQNKIKMNEVYLCLPLSIQSSLPLDHPDLSQSQIEYINIGSYK